MGPEAEETLLARIRGTALKAVTSLDECVQRVGESLQAGRKYDVRKASHLAYLTKHVAQILGELRKLEKHDKDVVLSMTPAEQDELVREYVAEMPRDRRGAFRALLDDLDRNEALL